MGLSGFMAEAAIKREYVSCTGKQGRCRTSRLHTRTRTGILIESLANQGAAKRLHEWVYAGVVEGKAKAKGCSVPDDCARVARG